MQALSLEQKQKRLIEKIGQKKYDKLLKNLEQNELDKELAKKLVEIEFKRDGEYYHWEQEVIRLAHFYAKEKAERRRKVQAAILKATEAGRRRREDSERRANAAAQNPAQYNLHFGEAGGIRKEFTLRF